MTERMEIIEAGARGVQKAVPAMTFIKAVGVMRSVINELDEAGYEITRRDPGPVAEDDLASIFPFSSQAELDALR